MVWGILIAGFILFGMLVLDVVSLVMAQGSVARASAQTQAERATEAADLKKAA